MAAGLGEVSSLVRSMMTVALSSALRASSLRNGLIEFGVWRRMVVSRAKVVADAGMWLSSKDKIEGRLVG